MAGLGGSRYSGTLGLAGVHHLGLTVSDVEKSSRWYADVLGFSRIGEFRAPGSERRHTWLDRGAAEDALIGAIDLNGA